MRIVRIGAVLALAAAALSAQEPRPDPARASARGIVPSRATFETLGARLEALRRRWRVPGMTAVVSLENTVVWEQPFGMADLAGGRPASAGTMYHLCSLTKPFAAVVLLQLVEQGRLNLDAPASAFGVALPDAVTVRHLLTHTSSGTPGRDYRYDGGRFAELDKVIATVTGRTFAGAVAERVLTPLNLADTSPNPLAPEACAQAGRDASAVAARMAQGYDEQGKPVAYPQWFLSAAGLVSTAADMARFSIALDGTGLLRADTLAQMFTGARSTNGQTLPYGLGWFVQPRKPDPLVWHYGRWVGSSSLIVKIPARRLTFVLLANSDGLSREFGLGRDDSVLRSPFARAFVEVLGQQ